MTMATNRRIELANKKRELDQLDLQIIDLARRLARLEAEVELAERRAKRRGEKR